eukprot:scaffold12630_cov118-Isochrysis_galbana.AAC.2
MKLTIAWGPIPQEGGSAGGDWSKIEGVHLFRAPSRERPLPGIAAPSPASAARSHARSALPRAAGLGARHVVAVHRVPLPADAGQAQPALPGGAAEPAQCLGGCEQQHVVLLDSGAGAELAAWRARGCDSVRLTGAFPSLRTFTPCSSGLRELLRSRRGPGAETVPDPDVRLWESRVPRQRVDRGLRPAGGPERGAAPPGPVRATRDVSEGHRRCHAGYSVLHASDVQPVRPLVFLLRAQVPPLHVDLGGGRVRGRAARRLHRPTSAPLAAAAAQPAVPALSAAGGTLPAAAGRPQPAARISPWRGAAAGAQPFHRGRRVRPADQQRSLLPVHWG